MSKAKPKGGRPPYGPRKDVPLRIPADVVAALDRRSKREGHFSRNETAIQAFIEHGDWPDGARPDIKPVMATAPKAKKPSTASKVATAKRPAEKAGARLDKKAATKRSGPPIPKGPVPRAEIEETV